MKQSAYLEKARKRRGFNRIPRTWVTAPQLDPDPAIALLQPPGVDPREGRVIMAVPAIY
jgi:hypothetical protein